MGIFFSLTYSSILRPGVADPHHFHADSDLAFHFNANPDLAFHFISDPDRTLLLIKVMGICDHWSIDSPGLPF